MNKPIEWLEYNDVLFTSLVVWNNNFIPYQIMIFLNEKNNCEFYIKFANYISGFKYKLINLRTNRFEEKLFNLVFHIKYLLDTKENSDISFSNKTSTAKDKLFLFSLFMLDYQMDYIKQYKVPEHGFYSLALNFNIIVEKLNEWLEHDKFYVFSS